MSVIEVAINKQKPPTNTKVQMKISTVAKAAVPWNNVHIEYPMGVFQSKK